MTDEQETLDREHIDSLISSGVMSVEDGNGVALQSASATLLMYDCATVLSLIHLRALAAVGMRAKAAEYDAPICFRMYHEVQY